MSATLCHFQAKTTTYCGYMCFFIQIPQVSSISLITPHQSPSQYHLYIYIYLVITLITKRLPLTNPFHFITFISALLQYTAINIFSFSPTKKDQAKYFHLIFFKNFYFSGYHPNTQPVKIYPVSIIYFLFSPPPDLTQ